MDQFPPLCSNFVALRCLPHSEFVDECSQGQQGEREMKDLALVNSFSAVIEKIERLYMVCGLASSLLVL